MSSLTGNKKRKYHVLDWKTYNQGLCDRYRINFWITDKVIKDWYVKASRPKPGSPFIYSRTAILVCHQLRCLFHLSLRATQGFLESFFQRMGIPLTCPHYSVLSRRHKELRSLALPRQGSKKALFALVDSTGLKVYGQGEWRVKLYRASQRRTWRKLHLVIDPVSQEIMVNKMTLSREHDSKALIKMFPKLPKTLSRIWGDGAYDTSEVYAKCYEQGISPVIPPAKNSQPSCRYRRTPNRLGRTRLIHERPHMIPKDSAVEYINQYIDSDLGRSLWKKNSFYHLRSLVETAMMRFKQTFSDKLKSRTKSNQEAEIQVKCIMLNKMIQMACANASPIKV